MATAMATRQRFNCDHCEKSYSQKAKLNFHIANTHGAGECPTKCSYCTEFPSKSAKEEHEGNVHMGNRRFPCDMCDKRFTRVAFLNGNKRSHHNSVKLKCNTCQATFCFMQSLREHKGQCGRDVGERAEFDCSLCDASFTTKSAAMLHERSTQGEQRHVCENCGKSYKYKSSYRKHKTDKH